MNKDKMGKKIENITSNAKKVVNNVTEKTKNVAIKSKEKVVETIDVNGDGRLDIEDIIVDPAAGGFSVLEACQLCNRNFLGGDLLS